MLMLRVTAGVCVVLLTACQSLESPASATTSRLVVHAVLNTKNYGYQFILLSRARTGVNPTVIGGIGDDEPVPGATVTITAPNGTAVVATDDPGCNCQPGVYRFNTFDFGASLYQVQYQGGTYTLHVRTPLGEEVSGTMTAPSDTSSGIYGSTRVFVRARDTLRLSWRRLPGARSYEVVIGIPRAAQYRTFADTSIAVPGTALTIEGDDVFPIGQVEVTVSAVDVNYYDYYRAQSDPFAGAPPSHLTGAVGVFGAYVPMLGGQLQVR
jgi:hypothetical protein